MNALEVEMKKILKVKKINRKTFKLELNQKCILNFFQINHLLNEKLTSSLSCRYLQYEYFLSGFC